MASQENPAAFPSQLREASNPGDHDPETGMTLRDYFAGQALAGMMANEHRTGHHGRFADWAADAYRFSDAMLAARVSA